MKQVFFLLVLSGFFLSCLARQDSIPPKRIYNATQIIVPPEIDGWITDEAWEKVQWEGDFMMYEPYDNRPAIQKTAFKLIFDHDHLYIAIRAFDSSPDSIVSRLTRRDDMDGDFVAFQFDSYHDLQTGFTFFASAAGSKMDALQSNDGDSEDLTWDPIWWVETQIDDRGWTLEARIPFSQLRFDKHSNGIWGFQVARAVFRTGEVSVWQPIARNAPGWIHLIGELHGLQNINPRKQADLTPYAVAGIETFQKDPENPFRSDGKNYVYNAGLDAKIGVTNNFTLDFTVNPDFGQVEADPSEVNLTAFETFFEEKRPFFIEGKNLFDYDMAIHNMDNLFYSRRIGRRPQYDPDLDDNEYACMPRNTNILGAAKLTGKTRDGLSIGIMESMTNREKTEIDRDGERRYETVEPLTNYFASRVSKDYNKGNRILGGLFTATHRFTDEAHLDVLHDAAYSGGIDFQQYFKDRNYILKLSGYASHVRGSEEAILNTQEAPSRYYQRPDADYVTLDSTRTSLSGYGGKLEFGKTGGNLKYMAFLNFKSPGLELNDIGYLRSADEIIQIFWIGYRFTEPFSIFRSANINFNQWNCWDYGGRHQVIGANINGHAEFKNYWNLAFFSAIDSKSQLNTMLRGGPTLTMPGQMNIGTFIGSNTRKKLTAEFSLDYSILFDNAGKEQRAGLEIGYKPISNLQLSLEPGFSKRYRELQYVTQENFEDADRYVFGTIDQKTLNMSIRINLILSPELTIQYWGQPFICSGKYTDFKHIIDPKAHIFEERFRVFDPSEIRYDAIDEVYRVNENASGLSYSFDNPDFNIKEFLSNLVFRWEYRPGSYVYLVWSQTREDYNLLGNARFRNDILDVWDNCPQNVFMLKLSYRIGR